MVPQPKPPQRPSTPENKARYTLAIAIAVIALLLLGGSAIWATNLLRGQPGQGSAATSTPSTSHSAAATPNVNPTGPISPLIFGTNMGLFNDHDQVLQSDQTRTLMQQLHIKIVRVPARNNITSDVFIQALQDIKQVGAVPLVVLNGVQSPDTMLSSDITTVKDVQSVFGDTTVYYEFGNEDDYHGVPVAQYTAGWNTVIPQLKKLSPHANFIGPVSWQYDEPYLISFLQNAKVQPDEISWHEYTCDLKWSNDTCLNNLDKWTTHISAARKAMATTIGKVLPIMITEWNYTASQSTQSNGQPIDDGKYNDEQFMTQWTTKALQTLADNRVFASMQYTVTDTALPMITYNQDITTQGTAFQTLYQKMFPSGS
ncbi:MAG TPA: hypothetical protein VL485_16525 [Ktedonobacteraceae bacterium]|jgi:hypothetical protein|nr:hypothetical protein [Ktedonobacteraceae bacterium]